MEKTFKEKDLVTHVTNPAQVMIVTKATNEYAWCSWVTRNGKYKDAQFYIYEITDKITGANF
jgi:hypothetical protein